MSMERPQGVERGENWQHVDADGCVWRFTEHPSGAVSGTIVSKGLARIAREEVEAAKQ